MTGPLQALLQKTCQAVAGQPALAEFVGPALRPDLPLAETPPFGLPVTTLVLRGDWPDPLAAAVKNAAPLVRWQQSYSKADGFSADYLNRYGWFNLVSSEGHFVADEIRVSIGYWGAGLIYREHWHAPEEIYLVLAGGARFLAEGRAPVDARAGDRIHHRPNQKHAIEMRPGPLLAMAFWKGSALLEKSGLS